MPEDKKTLKDIFSRPEWRIVLAFGLVLLFLLIWNHFFAANKKAEYVEISYSQLIEQLDARNILNVTIQGLEVSGEFRKKTDLVPSGETKALPVSHFITYLPSFQGEGILSKLEEKGVSVQVLPPEQRSLFGQILIALLPWVIIIGVWIFIMRRSQQQLRGGPGGLFSFGSSKAKLFDVKKPKITYADVAGMDNVKQELRETIQFLREPGRFKAIGAKVPKGVLLIGSPGTGKTLLARATAGEAEVPFYSISASEFIEMFVGVGASRVRDMFRKARDTQPSIIFIDEIDAVGRTRGAGFGGGHDEREQTLNQLLSEMDGFEPHEEVIIMAATNRPDVLDPALLRPGRFDRRIVIDKPGWKERLAILEIHARNKKMSDDVDLESIAKGTPGMSGADLENIVNEAALLAVRKNREHIEHEDFEEALDKVLMGAIREETISDMEKKITAYHEAGHTLVAWNLPYTDPIHKVSIIPRGMAMGVTQLVPEEDRHYYPKSYLLNRLSVALAGRAAEKIVFGDVSTGAQNDLKEATSLAEKMVAQWGMSEKVGPINLGRGEEHPFLGRELAQPKRYSEEMAWMIDQEIQRIIVEAEAKADEILEKKKGNLDDLAAALIKEEVLDREEVEKIIGPSLREVKE